MKDSVDEPRREKENMDEPQEEFIQDAAVPSHDISEQKPKQPAGPAKGTGSPLEW